MDETRIPLKFNGRAVLAAPLKESQMFVLATIKTDRFNTADMHRLFRIIESVLGPDQWSEVEDEMLSGTVDIREFVAFLPDLIQGTRDHSALTSQEEEPSPTVANTDIDAQLLAAEAAVAALKAQRGE